MLPKKSDTTPPPNAIDVTITNAMLKIMTTAAPIKITKETFQIETTRIRLVVNQRLQPNSRKISILNQPMPNLKIFEKNCLKILKSRPIRKKSLEMKTKNLNLVK
jgi:hypothetical protein